METMLKKIVEYDYERVSFLNELIVHQTHVKKRKRKKEREMYICKHRKDGTVFSRVS